MAPFRWLKILLTIIVSNLALLDGNRDDKATNVGYARVSRQDRNPQMQRGELEAAGCERIFEERISSRKESRAELQRPLEYCRQGDVLVVWKLDRLGRSLLKELLGLMGELHERGVEFRSPRESLDTTTFRPASPSSTCSPPWRGSSGHHPREDGGGAWGGAGQG
jgi:hypothetical protein